MNEIVIRLRRNGAAVVQGGELLLGYAGNRGNYQLRLDVRDEWKGLPLRAHWHTPGGSGTTLVENGILNVPAEVTAVPGTGCITFEGTDGTRTVTSADVHYRVSANSSAAKGTVRMWDSGTVPDPPPTPDEPGTGTYTARLGLAVLGRMILGRS